MRGRLLLLCLLIIAPVRSFAVTIVGEISDIQNRQAVANVSIVNIYTNVSTYSDAGGRFTIIVEKGQLLEFRKMGYKTLRIRIPEGNIPAYFRVMMMQGPVELPEFDLQAQEHTWPKDSARYHDLYKNAIDFPKLEGLDVIRHPFSALSKRNRQIWAFQKEYNYWEQQKYIDYTFNKQLVTNLTGLKGDSLDNYMRRYRPAYEQLRSMNEYTFYTYIKESVDVYRYGRRYRPSIRRSTN